MRALVTGGSGFVGSHLIELLLRRGDVVTALVRSPAKASRLVELGVRRVHGDLDDLPALRSAVDGSEIIYHVAGRVAAADERSFLDANQGGTQNLVAAATAAGRPRFVLVSSLAAAGPSRPGRPHRGDETPRPVSAYGRSKLAGERVVRHSALPWCIVRPPMVYGPRDRELLRVFRLCRRGLAPVFGDGGQELCAVYAPDLVEALVAVGTSEATVEGTYYACGDERFTSAEFVGAVGRALGRRVSILRVPAGLARPLLRGAGLLARAAGRTTLLAGDKVEELLQPAWTADPGPLTRATEWRAAHDLASGLAETARWYREAGWL